MQNHSKVAISTLVLIEAVLLAVGHLILAFLAQAAIQAVCNCRSVEAGLANQAQVLRVLRHLVAVLNSLRVRLARAVADAEVEHVKAQLADVIGNPVAHFLHRFASSYSMQKLIPFFRSQNGQLKTASL